jgi:hypothetical protein
MIIRFRIKIYSNKKKKKHLNKTIIFMDPSTGRIIHRHRSNINLLFYMGTYFYTVMYICNFFFHFILQCPWKIKTTQNISRLLLVHMSSYMDFYG